MMMSTLLLEGFHYRNHELYSSSSSSSSSGSSEESEEEEGGRGEEEEGREDHFLFEEGVRQTLVDRNCTRCTVRVYENERQSAMFSVNL